MPSPIRRLPDSELALMQIIWQLDSPVSRTDIESALAGRRPLAATTILTFLSRLCDKGSLAVERHGKTNVYTPLVSQKDYLAAESRDMLDRLFGGSLTAFAASLVDAGISRRELDALRAMLEEDRL